GLHHLAAHTGTPPRMQREAQRSCRISLPSRPRRTGFKGDDDRGEHTAPRRGSQRGLSLPFLSLSCRPGYPGVRSRGPRRKVHAREGGVVAIIAVAVVLAGSKLPQLARNVGRAQGEFKKGIREGAVEEPEPAPPAQAIPPAPATPPAP